MDLSHAQGHVFSWRHRLALICPIRVLVIVLVVGSPAARIEEAFIAKNVNAHISTVRAMRERYNLFLIIM